MVIPTLSALFSPAIESPITESVATTKLWNKTLLK